MCKTFEIILENRNGNAHRIFGIENSNGCWEVNSLAHDRDGYVRISIDNVDTRLHRVVHSVFNGDIPDGMEVRHKCNNPSCSKPDHLHIGTHKENMNDKKKCNKPIKKSVCLSKQERVEIVNDKSGTIETLARDYNVSFKTVINIRRNRRLNKLSKRMPDKPSISTPDILKSIKNINLN